MILYLLLCIWIVLTLSIFTPKKSYIVAGQLIRVNPVNRQLERFVVVFTVLILCVLTGFRSFEIGNDTYNYVYYFNFTAEEGITKDLRFEFGYQLYSFLLSKISSNAQILLVVSAIISYAVVAKQILKNSKDITFSLCLLFVFLFFVLYEHSSSRNCNGFYIDGIYKHKTGKIFPWCNIHFIRCTFSSFSTIL